MENQELDILSQRVNILEKNLKDSLVMIEELVVAQKLIITKQSENTNSTNSVLKNFDERLEELQKQAKVILDILKTNVNVNEGIISRINFLEKVK
ncbi:MAG: hypothetical protein JST94_06490 [Bacteroidetes bacterium]|nr:hypothetical protein [Bacteroidota bacterium]MBS1671086.1 hypothetical protein [Bacteroidota bacterium]